MSIDNSISENVKQVDVSAFRTVVSYVTIRIWIWWVVTGCSCCLSSPKNYRLHYSNSSLSFLVCFCKNMVVRYGLIMAINLNFFVRLQTSHISYSHPISESKMIMYFKRFWTSDFASFTNLVNLKIWVEDDKVFQTLLNKRLCRSFTNMVN